MTPNKEDYLKIILELSESEETLVSNKAIATALSVSAASVTEMVSKLVKEDYIRYEPYYGVTLTETGRQVANRLLRKHRIWEVFLVDKLGMSWSDHQVHEEAERLEHSSSDDFIDRLEEFLNFPKKCPHGGIIPEKDSSLPVAHRMRFESLAVGERFVVTQVTDEKTLLAYVEQIGLQVGADYVVVEKDVFDEALIIEAADGTRIRVSPKAGSKVFIDYVTA